MCSLVGMRFARITTGGGSEKKTTDPIDHGRYKKAIKSSIFRLHKSEVQNICLLFISKTALCLDVQINIIN